jgi:hypothetical protein
LGNIWCNVSIPACLAVACVRSISAVISEKLKVGSFDGVCLRL